MEKGVAVKGEEPGESCQSLVLKSGVITKNGTVVEGKKSRRGEEDRTLQWRSLEYGEGEIVRSSKRNCRGDP